MSILIKGVNIPTTDVMRVVITPLGVVFEKYDVIAYAENIPPHGDLIDRDAVKKEFAEMCERCGEKYDAICRACYVDTCDDIVDDVPAVIESEEE